MDIEKLVNKKLSEKAKTKIKLSTMIEDLGIDSLDLVELVTEVEDELNIKMSDEDLMNIKNVSDIVEALKKAIK